MTVWNALVDHFGATHQLIGPVIAGLIWIWNWPRFSEMFERRAQTMNAHWRDITAPTNHDGVWADNWYKIRRVCAVWQAGLIYAAMYRRYQVFWTLIPTIIVSAVMFLPVLANLPDQTPAVQAQNEHIAVAGLYATILVVLAAARYLRAGVDKANELIRIGARGDL